MKLTIERSALLRSLSHVQNVVERRSTIPILANVKLETGDGELTLTATDLDLALATREPAEILEPGGTTVAAHLLFEIVRKLPEGCEVELAQPPSSRELVLRAARSVFQLPTLPAEEFPPLGEDGLDIEFLMPAPDLARLIDKTRFAISTEETRYYLNGIHMHPLAAGAASVLRGVATDGHRLARVEVSLPAGAERLPPIIMPRKTVNELRKLLGDSDAEVSLAVSPNRMRCIIDRAVLVSRLIDGPFPDYERVIPKPEDTDKVAVLEVRAFKDAVDRVSTISTERTRAVKLGFADAQVTISAVSAEAGRATEELDAEYSGAPLEIGFNARYILDILGEIEGERVRMEMTSAAAPTVLRDPADSSTLYVLMPMRV